MNLLGSLWIAFSMYSRIPVPQVEWTQERMKYAMCFFPVIGIFVGGFELLCLYIFSWLGMEETGYYVAAVLPLILTGGIHMDGYLDVTDARASHMDREKKLEILKDPHTGAFAIIGCSVYLILYLGILHGISYNWLPALALSFVLSRALSGCSVVMFPKAKNTGLANMFGSQAQRQVVACSMVFYILAVLVGMIYFYGVLAGLLYMAAALLVFLYYYRLSMKEFGGMTGDLAGYFLQVCELVLLAVAVFLPKLLTLLG